MSTIGLKTKFLVSVELLNGEIYTKDPVDTRPQAVNIAEKVQKYGFSHRQGNITTYYPVPQVLCVRIEEVPVQRKANSLHHQPHESRD